MRYPIAIIGIALVVATAGCPLFPTGNFTFRSADLGGGANRFFGAEGDAVGAPEADDQGDGEQARTVVEPDVIRRNGDLLYILNQFRGLTIVNISSGELLSTVPTFGFPRDLYFIGDRAYVLVGYAQDVQILDDDLIAIEVTSRLHVINVANPAAPDLEASFDIAGDLVDSRVVGDVLYAVTSEYFYYGAGGGGIPVDAVEVVRKQNSTSYVTSLLLGDPENIQVADELEFNGAGQVIQVSPTHAFVATPDYAADETAIAVVNIADPNGALVLEGSVSVPGYVADRFKLDAWNGTLRVVSASQRFQSEVYVSTIDLATRETLRNLRLEDASGDRLFATRFDGPLAYVVTYFVVDPLFVVDLSDPVNPQIRAPLEVPGYSIHIEPRGDRLIALGVDDTNGSNTVAVSIFDVSGDPRRLDIATFGEGWAWSNAFNDVKAFTVLDDTIIVPFSGYSGEAGGYERLQFLSYTRDNLEVHDSVDLNGTILRSFAYEDDYFGVTTEQLARISGPDLDNLEVQSSVTLAENIVDFAELGEDRGVEIVARYDDGITEVRVVDGNLDPLSSVSVDVGAYGGVFAHNGKAVVYGTDYSENTFTGFYRVALVSVDAEGNAALEAETTVAVEPYYGYFYYGYGGPEPAFGVATDALFAPFPYNGDESAFLASDRLILRGFSGEANRRVGDVFGGNQSGEVLAIVELDPLAWNRTVALNFERIVAIDQAGELLYIGTKEDAGGIGGLPLCAHYIQSFNPVTEALGAAANVPGVFVDYDPSRDVLVLRDYQWDTVSDVQYALQTVNWDGGENVTPIDSIELPGAVGEIFKANDNLFYSTYTEGLAIAQVAIDSSGNLAVGEGIRVTDYYGQLLGASGNEAYISIGAQAIATYDFTATPTLGQIIQVMGAPLKLVIGEENVYAPLGYFGLVTLTP